MMDDPDTPTIYRVSGEPPFPEPGLPSLPPSVVPRHVTLRDRQTVATIIPYASRYQVPDSLLRYLSDQFNKEIEGGDTYPMMEMMPFEKFASYWFQNFGAIMLLGDIGSADEVTEGKDWSKECLGAFYIKPNYPGRSSHVCNAGFIVTDASRNRGVGRLMGETYLEWAPKLGYTYSVFNLVYETNVASCKIWDALGFKRIGRVKGCGNLKSYPDRFIDAIIYGRDLGDGSGNGSSEELVSEERFDKIKFYLKYGRYPNGADRAEKSRLRSAATHYKLLDNDVLMLKDKEVISDPQRQYDIARSVHNQTHAGINKTTATIAERYHWSRIKETVSDVIRNCPECKELGKTQMPLTGGNGGVQNRRSALSAPPAATVPSKRSSPSPSSSAPRDLSSTGSAGLTIPEPSHILPFAISSHSYHATDLAMVTPSHTLRANAPATIVGHDSLPRHNPMLQDQSHGLHSSHHATNTSLPLQNPHGVSGFQPIDPQIISQPSTQAHHHPLHHYSFHSPHTHDPDADTFQALLNGTSDVDPDLDGHHHHHHHHHDSGGGTHHMSSREDDEADQAAVDRDLEMLIEPQEDDDEDQDAGAGMAVDTVMDSAVGTDEAGGPGHTKMTVNHLLSTHVDGGDSGGRDSDGRDVYDVEFSGPG